MTSSEPVAIVIPTLNGGDDLGSALLAIRRQEGPFRPHVVAVDSGSTDGTLQVLEAHGATVLAVPPGQFNHGETRNLALRAVKTEFAVLTVQDAIPAAAGWLAALVAPLQRDPTLAATWARQQPRATASRLTSFYLANWAGAQASGRTVGPIASSQFAALTPGERHLLCAFDNVCACVRMSVWRQHPFPRTRIAEDLEWALTVLQSGHRLAHVPEAVVIHSHDRPASYELRRTYAVHQRLQSLFGLATIPDLASLAHAVAVTLPLHLRLAASEPRGKGRALARGAALALAMPLGQYLGARSAREGRELLNVGRV
jgi:rhamnosyltransferase